MTMDTYKQIPKGEKPPPPPPPPSRRIIGEDIHFKWPFKKKKKKILNYKIVYSENPFTLEKEIQLHLKDGWILQGGVSNSYGKTDDYNQGYKSDCIHYAQAMVKKI